MNSKITQLIQTVLPTPKDVERISDDLSGIVVVVTGASRGMGMAIANVLLSQGAIVVSVARKFPDTFLCHENQMIVSADVTKVTEVRKVIKKVMEKYGKIDVVVNNAGVFLDKPLDKTLVKDFENILDVNMLGIFLMCKTVIPVMKQQKSGFIINIGSKISRNSQVGPYKVLYATSKYAVEGFSFALNRELKRFGIRVTCLMPGTVNTFMSLKSANYLSPTKVGEIIAMLIKFSDIDFENIVFKSVKQNNI
jgi:NAD(P)-dependent dehydrogenase (short-subunit alcohol dehydrogenase family)